MTPVAMKPQAQSMEETLLTRNTDHGEDEVIEVAPSKHPNEDTTLKGIECIDEEKHETLLLVQFEEEDRSIKPRSRHLGSVTLLHFYLSQF
jgi:hypothetical protein